MKSTTKKTPKGSFFKSLRFRILVILTLAGVLPAMLALHVVISSYQKKAFEVRRDDLRRECRSIAKMLVESGYMENPGDEAVDSKLELLSNFFHGRIMLVDRDYRIIKDSYGIDEGRILYSPLVIQSLTGKDANIRQADSQMMDISVPIESPSVEEPLGAIWVSVRVEEVAKTVQEMEHREVLLAGGILLVAVVLALCMSTILVRPFARVTKAIEELTDGYQDGEISVPDYTETALITGAFNRLLARMKLLDESRNEFVSNVSHELKTPMTSMKVLADSLVGQTGVPEELYQEFLGDITKEVDRENKIISDLLSLVKMDKKAGGMVIVHTSINSLIESVLKRLHPIAEQRNISLILESYREVEADVDEVKFTSAITNLVENGIKYNVDDGWVRVTLDADHQNLFITVADSGMGIPRESQEKIFERFYRVDTSHSREIGGTGLGLAITRSAIAAHQGTITVESTPGVGTTFRVRLPLTYIP